MPRIVMMRPNERRPDHYDLTLDDGRELSLNEALVAAERLGPGDELDEAGVARLMVAEQERTLFDRAARLLGVRPRSRAELRRRLLQPSPRRAPPSEQAVDHALDRLGELGYLDDTAFATYWTEQRDRFSPRSARALRQELRQRGVDAETAAATADPEGDEPRAISAGRKRLRSLEGLDEQAFTTRLGGYLQRRGFSYGVARAAIRALWAESRGEAREGAPVEGEADDADEGWDE